VAPPLADTLRAEADAQRRLGQSADHRGAVEAFLGKQKPAFDGR
jgi:2-(1,2-epoxy-1,2-dihydrophenyl)acetyl-CoA isomerase